jgi:hypothetical protein
MIPKTQRRKRNNKRQREKQSKKRKNAQLTKEEIKRQKPEH